MLVKAKINEREKGEGGVGERGRKEGRESVSQVHANAFKSGQGFLNFINFTSVSTPKLSVPVLNNTSITTHYPRMHVPQSLNSKIHTSTTTEESLMFLWSYSSLYSISR